MIKVGTEREIAFDKSLREKRQETYDINNYELVDYTFKDGGDRKVYKNFNFSIFLTDKCNADCKFCVAQLRYEHKNLMYTKNKIIPEGEYMQYDEYCKYKQQYLDRLEQVLQIVRPLNPSVSITGGEPTINRELLLDVMKLVDKYDFRKRTLTTNGTYLDKELIEQFSKYKLDHLNISIPHYQAKKAADLMVLNQVKYGKFLLSLKLLIKDLKEHNISPRISCLLTKEGISTVEGIKKYIDVFHNLSKVDNFIFRQMMQHDKTANNQEKIEYCDKNVVYLDDIWKEMDKDEYFTPYLNLIGYYYYVEIYKHNNITIASEAADLNVQYNEKKKNKDLVYEMVFHPNGNLCGSWIDKEDILDKYDNNLLKESE